MKPYAKRLNDKKGDNKLNVTLLYNQQQPMCYIKEW